MDVHRSRFVPYPPSAINAFAFSHPSENSTAKKTPSNFRLAIGRANGDIEIWNPSRGAWYQESILHGGKDRSIEGLAWTQDPEDEDKNGSRVPGKLRLFSVGYSAAVTEWNLATGQPARHSSGNYSEIWCMEVQPRSVTRGNAGSMKKDRSDQYQCIAVGCANGSLVLLSTSDGDLQFKKTLARPSKKGARLLSLTFQNTFTVIAGHADSTMRVFDTRSGQLIRNMSLGAGPKDGPREILVWSVKCTDHGTIISGDSTGTVCFWDTKTHSLMQRIKSHDADILAVAVSADGNVAFSGGMDRSTVLYRRMAGEKGKKGSRWAKVAHSRLHDHDLKAMATFESRDLSILATGGLDANPVIVPISEFGNENHRTLSTLSQEPPLLSAPKRRLIVSWWDREVSIWSISKQRLSEEPQGVYVENRRPKGRKLVGKLVVQGEESITSVDMTQDASVLAVSTISEIKLFSLSPEGETLRIRKIDAPPQIGSIGARIIKFSPDQKWLCVVAASSRINVYKLVVAESALNSTRVLSRATMLRRIRREPLPTKIENGFLGQYERTVNRIAFSEDSKILAAADLSGYLDTWVLEGHEDTTQDADMDAESLRSSSDSDTSHSDQEDSTAVVLGQKWIRNPSATLLPRLPATALVLSFRPSNRSTNRSPTNGVTAPDLTHPKQHPYSHYRPNGEDRLLVVTAANQVLEFHVLAGGRLTPWSRKNPPQSFPSRFRDLRDPTKGVVWDISASQERVWLYGVAWLWMFDLAQDIRPSPSGPATTRQPKQIESQPNGHSSPAQSPPPAMHPSPQTLKRKRSPPPASRQRLHPDSGAGSLIPASRLSTGLGGRTLTRIDGNEDVPLSQRSRVINLRQGLARHKRAGSNGTTSGSEDDYDDDDSDDDHDGAEQEGKQRHKTSSTSQPGHDDAGLDNQDRLSDDTGPPATWHTLKYRPILGIVPLLGCLNPGYRHGEKVTQGAGGSDADPDAMALDVNGDGDRYADDSRLEVVLVERPLWDAELPDRFVGKRDR